MMTTESNFRFIGLVLVLISFAISVYHRRQAEDSGEKISDKEEGSLILSLRKILGLTMWLSMLAYFINPAWMSWSQLTLPLWVRWVGVALMALCAPLFYWIFSNLGKNVTKTVAIREEHSLVIIGPYRWVRHPLYTAGFIYFIGLSLLSANWFIFLLILLTFAILLMRTPIEEAKLIERFGDEYRQYMKETGRYIPKIKR
ncbi:MAG: isoprenylcysteine carboxylmethyltransferase family protein [Chloroflexi bacterium]|nr:isoprenylcysteine carboxylmethyltransferase family protein [Chloroflexota bacterium]